MANSGSIKMQKKRELRRKLRKLRNVVHSDSNNTTTILQHAIICILDNMKRIGELHAELENMDHVNHIEHQPPSLEVKVEEQGENRFRFNVASASEGGKNYLALIVEALEEKGIDSMSISVSRVVRFEMEAIVEVTQAIDSSVLTQVITNAIEKSGVN